MRFLPLFPLRGHELMAGLFGVLAILLVAPVSGKAETPIIRPGGMEMKSMSPAEARQAAVQAAYDKFHRGAVGEAARAIRQLANETTDRAAKVGLLRDLMEMCSVAYDAGCTEQAVVEAFGIVNAEPSLKSLLPELNAYLIGAQVWRDNKASLAKVFEEKGIRWFTPDQNPVSAASANLAASAYFLRSNDRRGASTAYSAAVVGLLLIDPDNAYGISKTLIDMLEALIAQQDFVGARTLSRLAAGYLASNLDHEGPAWAKYVDLAGQLAALTARSEVAGPILAEASRLNGRLDIDEGVKTYRLAVENSLRSLTLLLNGKLDDALEVHAQHPLQPRKNDIIGRGQFEMTQEFYFAVADTLIQFLQKSGGEPPRWAPLFETSAFAKSAARWQAETSAAKDLESYRQFARGLIASSHSKAEAGTLLRQAARLRIENFETVVKGKFEGFPLPSPMDQFIIRAALSSLSDLSDLSEAAAADRDDLMLRGSEMLLRTLRHQISDFAVVLGAQTSERERAGARSYHLLLEQKRDWEFAQIKALLDHQSRNIGAIVTAYSDLIKSVSRLEDKFASGSLHAEAAGYPDVKQVQAALSDNEVFVTYVPTFGGIGRLCIAKSTITSSFASVDAAKLDLDVKLLRLALVADDAPDETRDSQFPAASAIRVHQFMFDGLAPCLARGSHVHVAVPEPVAGIPLAALLDRIPPAHGEGYDLTSAQWLGQSFAFSTVVSARHWLGMRRSLAHRQASRPYLGIGDPDLAAAQRVASVDGSSLVRAGLPGNELAELPPLPETAEELASARQLFGAPASDVLIGKAASEEAFRSKDLGTYDVIHFATHGLLKGELDGLSEPALVLSPVDAADSFDNGLLTASEITLLSLNARLVVLSACNTARIDTGTASRGAADLQAAFSVAGAPAMLASLWPVETSTARDLVSGFFQSWQRQKHKGAASALAAATRDYLKHADRAHQHPRFWATFVLLGDGNVQQSTAAPAGAAAASLSALPGNAAGEIVDAKPYQGKIVVSMQGDWDGRSMAGIIADPLNLESADRISSHEVGAGQLLVAGSSLYATGYRISAHSVPIVRKIGQGGGIVWQRSFEDLEGYRLNNGVVINDVIILLLDSKFGTRDRGLVLIKLDLEGREIARASIKGSAADGLTGKTSVMFKTGGDLILAVNSQAASGLARTRPESFGLPSACRGAPTATVFRLDPTSLAATELTSIANFRVSAIGEMDGTRLILGGEVREPCAANGTARIFEIATRPAADHAAQPFWTDDDLFPSRIGAIEAVGKGLSILVNRQRSIGIRSIDRKMLDLGSKRWGDDERELSEFSVIDLDRSGAVQGRYDSSFGLSAYAQGMVRAHDALSVFGALGGRPAISIRDAALAK